MKKFLTLIAVAVMAFAAQAAELTVAEGTETQTMLPVYGFYVDRVGTFDQMIYPADMLTDIVGGQINGLKFYADETGIKFADVTLQLSLKTVDQLGYENAIAVTDATVVAEVTPAKGETELTFALNEPFEYAGGNLMVEVRVIATAGDWGSTKFYGVETENVASYCEYVWSNWGDPSVETKNFLPMATFTYEAGTTPQPEYTPVAPKVTIQTNDADVVVEGIIEGGAADYGTVTLYQIDEEGVRHEIENPESFTRESEDYVVNIVAVATYENGEVMESEPVQVTVSKKQEKPTGVNEMNADKTVKGVRYFNMAGQEMQEANGMTIVVTTYTDGTTSAVKVMK
ncbi:MAG: hypothetical protein IKW85_14135 [Muribaculaceae bacterium]|nr:hypothetical protein [Muribaculaceae bacterium]